MHLYIGHFVHIMYYSVVRKMALYMADILEPEDKDKLHDNLLVGTSKVYSYACSLNFIMDILYMYVHVCKMHSSLYITTGYNGGISDAFSVGLGQISIKTTITQYS